jgi:hypothetical protein
MLPSSGPVVDRMVRIRECLNRYDYESARVELIALAEQLGIAGVGSEM